MVLNEDTVAGLSSRSRDWITDLFTLTWPTGVVMLFAGDILFGYCCLEGAA